MLLYLERDDAQVNVPFKSTNAKNGHFHYPLSFGGFTYDMQISAFGERTAIVGNECRLACYVPITFDHGDSKYESEVIENSFKSFDHYHTESGFY